MKTRRYVFISFLLTVLMVAVLVPSLLAPDAYDDILMTLNLGVAETVLGSWVLAIVNLVSHMARKKYLSGIKSYRNLFAVLIVVNVVTGIASILFEGGWHGSTAELMAIYLLPALLIALAVTGAIRRKTRRDP